MTKPDAGHSGRLSSHMSAVADRVVNEPCWVLLTEVVDAAAAALIKAKYMHH